jgi:type IV secretory pathway protease TraF
MRVAVLMLCVMCAGAGPATRPNELAALRAEPESLALGRWRTARAAAPVALKHRLDFLIARQR